MQTFNKNVQVDCDVETAVLNLSENHGYLATIQLFKSSWQLKDVY